MEDAIKQQFFNRFATTCFAKSPISGTVTFFTAQCGHNLIEKS